MPFAQVGFSVRAVAIYALDQNGQLDELQIVKVSPTKEACSAVKYSPDGHWLAVCNHDTSLYLLDAAGQYGVKRKLRKFDPQQRRNIVLCSLWWHSSTSDHGATACCGSTVVVLSTAVLHAAVLQWEL